MRFLLLCLSLTIIGLLLTGCSEYHAYDFNSSSNAECHASCEALMRANKCFEASPSYHASYMNGDLTNGQCSCYVRNCAK